MTGSERIAELRNIESRLIRRYSRIIKLLLLITIIFIICISMVFIGITLGSAHNWALFGIDTWIIAIIAIFGFFIILELIFYFHFYSVRNKAIELQKPKKEFIDGKRVYVFTYPKGKEGGIFSKTYIEIDNDNILRLRSLMIPPEDLWGKK